MGHHSEKVWGIIVLILLVLFTVQTMIIIENGKILQKPLSTQINPDGVLRSKEGLFDGLYYRWNGSFNLLPDTHLWHGNLTVEYKYADMYTIWESDDYHNTTDDRNVNETTRFYTDSGHWDYSGYDWLFINLDVQVGSVVPIIISYFSDRPFTVVAKQTILQKFLGRTFTCWRLRDDWGSIAYYDIYTGILVNGTFIHPYMMGDYTITPYQTNAFQVNLNAPKLTIGQVTPTNGSLMTEFTYSVNYSDSDNNYPTKMDVIIDGIAYPMYKTDKYDKNYIDGCIFEYSTYLNNNSHNYFFNTSDLGFSTRLPSVGNYAGPNVIYININQPVISGNVTPSIGNNWTRYRFELNYSDADNNPPLYINLSLNEMSIQMTKLDAFALNYMDGALYYYETRLDLGISEHFFSASDGKYTVRDPIGSNYSTPYVLPIYWPLADDVESGENGWVRTGNPISNSTYGWHIVNTTSVSPSHAWWCGNDKTGSYPGNWNTSLESPLLNLTPALNAYIVFNQKSDTSDWSDYGYVEIRINGTSQWTVVGSITGYHPIWTETTINITSYIGKYVAVRFRFESIYDNDYPGWYIDNMRVVAELNRFLPFLDEGSVTPIVGNTSTNFIFSVRYTDGDNNPPASIMLQINGTSNFPMSKQNTTDTNYQDGCIYIYQTKLWNYTYSFNFRTSDGKFEVLDPPVGTYSGPTVNYINANPPTLTNAVVTPRYAILGNSFTFQVTYTDIENKGPSYVTLHVNSTTYSMYKLYLTDMDYSDGCIYRYIVTLPEGFHIFWINASDFDYIVGDPKNGFYLGPWVIYSLSNNAGVTKTLNLTNNYDIFRFNILNNDWAAVAMRPSSGLDIDLSYHDFYNCSDLVAESVLSGDELELIGINGYDYNLSAAHFAKVWSVNGFGSYSIEAEYIVPDYGVPGGPFSGTISSTELVDVFEMANQTPYTPYRIDLTVPAGLDLSIYVMNQTGGKSSALAHTNLGGPGQSESLTVILPNNDSFAIIFIRENTGTGSYSFSVTADTTPPDLTIQSPLSKAYSVNTILVNLSSAAMDLHTMWYRVWNISGWVTYNITWSAGANIILADGNYTLFAWANDTQGFESAPKTVTFTIDTLAPSAIILSPLNQTYSDQQILINLTSGAPDLGAIWYRIFNRSLGNWVDLVNVIYSTPVLRNLPEGIYSIYAWANDTTGNIQAVPTSTKFTVNMPPIAIIEAPLNITYTFPVIQINLSSSAPDLHALWYKLSTGSTWVVNKTIWTQGATATLSDGIYTLYAWANDTSGLSQLEPTTITFSIDSTPPLALILSPMNQTYRSDLILINLTANEMDLAALWYRLFNLASMSWFDSNDVIWTTPTTRNLPDGRFIIYAWANDSVGNIQLIPSALYFTVGVPPTFLVNSPLNITYVSGVILIDIGCTAPDLDTIWYRIFDGNSWITNNITWTNAINLNLGEGTYWAFIWANDTYGNEFGTVVTFTIQYSSSDGWELWTIFLIIGIGVVCAVVVVYRIRKSQRKKKKSEDAKNSKLATGTFVERMKSKDLG